MFDSVHFEFNPCQSRCILSKYYYVAYDYSNYSLSIQDNVFLHEFLNDLDKMHYIQDADKSYSSYYYSLDNFLDNLVLNINLRKYFYLLLHYIYGCLPIYILTNLHELKNTKCIFVKDNY